MLEQLTVRNYVLIENLDVGFNDGFSVITGETGSGKSIILGALSLLLGAKADKDAIRKGCSSAEASGVFISSSPLVKAWLEDHDAEGEDGEIIIRRTVKESGRSLYTVNGIPVSRKEGEELGSLLVDISSQHAHQTLLRPGVYREMLDDHAGNGDLLAEYRREYTSLRAMEKERKRLSEEMARNAEERDYIEFCLSELEKAGLKEGEEEEIKKRLDVINSSEAIRENLSAAIDELRAGSSAISEALSYLSKAVRKDPALLELEERLEPVSIEAEDIAMTLRSKLSSLEFSEAELEELNSRLSVIQKMKRRFGGSVGKAIQTMEEYREKLHVIDDGDSLLEDLEKKINAVSVRVYELADRLSSSRTAAAEKLEKSISGVLRELGMPSAVFHISVERTDEGPDGADSVSFLIAPNKGEKLSYVQDTASGGELSRILLAIKASTGCGNGAETLLFDEIDAGLGGESANKVGDELRKLSSSSQVIAITHLPQIAVRASSHYLVSKEERDGRTVSCIRQIGGEEREKETARLLSGSTSGISLEHARSLLKIDE